MAAFRCNIWNCLEHFCQHACFWLTRCCSRAEIPPSDRIRSTQDCVLSSACDRTPLGITDVARFAQFMSRYMVTLDHTLRTCPAAHSCRPTNSSKRSTAASDVSPASRKSQAMTAPCSACKGRWCGFVCSERTLVRLSRGIEVLPGTRPQPADRRRQRHLGSIAVVYVRVLIPSEAEPAA